MDKVKMKLERVFEKYPRDHPADYFTPYFRPQSQRRNQLRGMSKKDARAKLLEFLQLKPPKPRLKQDCFFFEGE